MGEPAARPAMMSLHNYVDQSNGLHCVHAFAHGAYQGRENFGEEKTPIEEREASLASNNQTSRQRCAVLPRLPIDSVIEDRVTITKAMCSTRISDPTQQHSPDLNSTFSID